MVPHAKRQSIRPAASRLAAACLLTTSPPCSMSVKSVLRALRGTGTTLPSTDRTICSGLSKKGPNEYKMPLLKRLVALIKK